MSRAQTLRGLMRRYGREATLHLPDGWCSWKYHCFLQPLRYKNKMYLDGIDTKIGCNEQGHYLYIGPPEQDLTKLDHQAWIQIGEEKFTVSRGEKVFLNNEAVYVWAVLVSVTEERVE